MFYRPLKSTIIIVCFFILNSLVAFGVWVHRADENWGSDSSAVLGKAPSEMQELEYFNLDGGRPALSLIADSMSSVGDELASFVRPRGTYAPDASKSAVRYQGQQAEFVKAEDNLRLLGNVLLEQDTSSYRAQQITYFLKKDLLTGKGQVEVSHLHKKSGQQLQVSSDAFRGKPRAEWANFQGHVKGVLKPKLRFQAPLSFQSQGLELKGPEGVIELREDVFLKRGEMDITARNGDIFLEQMNKKLKYFILNDDVKVKEILIDSKGQPLKREAFAERLEGFGQDRLVLSGAPRVLQGKDVIKGYRITMREKMEFIEVEDAMSDVQVKDEQSEPAKERE